MINQQKQTQIFFEKFSLEWQARFKNKKFELFNTVQQRNNYVLDYVKKEKPKKFLDVGCGSGELIYKKKHRYRFFRIDDKSL